MLEDKDWYDNGIRFLNEQIANNIFLIDRCDNNIEHLKNEAIKERVLIQKGLPPTRFSFINDLLERFGLLKKEIEFQFSEEFIKNEILPKIALYEEMKENLRLENQSMLEKLKRFENDNI